FSFPGLPWRPSRRAALGGLIHDLFGAWIMGTELDDLFPPFWGIEETPRDLAMVKHHVRAAIESQAITRIPGGRAEQPFQVDVGEGASLIGFLDLSAIYPDRVYYLDFKSKKNLKYAKTPAKLKQDPQMQLGAACLFVEAAHSGQMPDRAELTHFYMQMDPADMKQKAVTVVVPRSEVEDFFTGTFLPVRDQMLKLKPVPLEDWEKVPHTTDNKNCRFCDFNTICSRAETPERYKARIDKMTAATEPPKPQPQQPTMGMFDDMAAIVTGGPSATVVTPAPAAAPTTQPTTQPTLTEAPADARVPWADPKCQMCGGLGIAPEGGPCPLCEFTAAASRKPSQFTVERVPGEGLRVNGTLYRLTTPVTQARATTPPPASAAPAAQEDPFARAQ